MYVPLMRSIVKNSILCSSLSHRFMPCPFSALGEGVCTHVCREREKERGEEWVRGEGERERGRGGRALSAFSICT